MGIWRHREANYSDLLVCRVVTLPNGEGPNQLTEVPRWDYVKLPMPVPRKKKLGHKETSKHIYFMCVGGMSEVLKAACSWAGLPKGWERWGQGGLPLLCRHTKVGPATLQCYVQSLRWEHFSADALVKTLTELPSECARELYWIPLTSLMRYKFPFSPCNVCKPMTLLKK